MFAATKNQGFAITFANGVTVSVQWGPGNYCSNRSTASNALLRPIRQPDGVWTCKNAETLVWAGPHKLDITKADGWNSPADVLALMNWAASLDAVDVARMIA